MENPERKNSNQHSSNSLNKYRSSSFQKNATALQQKFKFSEKELLLIKKRFLIGQ